MEKLNNNRRMILGIVSNFQKYSHKKCREIGNGRRNLIRFLEHSRLGALSLSVETYYETIVQVLKVTEQCFSRCQFSSQRQSLLRVRNTCSSHWRFLTNFDKNLFLTVRFLSCSKTVRIKHILRIMKSLHVGNMNVLEMITFVCK